MFKQQTLRFGLVVFVVLAFSMIFVNLAFGEVSGFGSITGYTLWSSSKNGYVAVTADQQYTYQLYFFHSTIRWAQNANDPYTLWNDCSNCWTTTPTTMVKGTGWTQSSHITTWHKVRQCSGCSIDQFYSSHDGNHSSVYWYTHY